jgi:hypothetical protein
MKKDLLSAIGYEFRDPLMRIQMRIKHNDAIRLKKTFPQRWNGQQD